LLQCLHRNSGPRRPIRMPKRLKLPPVHPGLACEDIRSPRPPRLYLRLYRRARILAGRARKQLFRAEGRT
jgi:hypothetical protein